VYTVVCVLHDSAGAIQSLLASLRRLPSPPPLVVIDTASRDDGPLLARAAGAAVLQLGSNPGFGAANNAGVAVVETPVTVLLNPDTEVPPGALDRLAARALAEDALHAPRLVDAGGRPERSAHPVPGTPGALLGVLAPPALLPRAVRERLEPWRARRPCTAGWAVGACLAARTATLRRLGPFDPDQFLFYEDMDLCLRARAAGVPTRFDPTVVVRHHGAHATRPAFGGEPHALLAQRRRAVVGATRGRRAQRLDDAAQALTFATRALAHGRPGGRGARRERAQLAAVLGAVRGAA
jgi:GT2 family glycosyltransferase